MLCSKGINKFHTTTDFYVITGSVVQNMVAVANTSDGNIMWLTEVIISYYKITAHKLFIFHS
jgi:hypothetical protein